jgi:beta-xylosidase
LNPVLPGWRADPEIHFFAGRYWIYPTISAAYEEQTRFEAWASSDMEAWTNEGTILDFRDVPWSTNRAAWAPTCAFANGKYHFIFSAGDGAGLGLAVSDNPAGPFVDALGKPLVKEYHHGAQPIDAHAYIDDDGTPYLYWGGWKHCVVARLSNDLSSLAEEPREITPADYVEGPFMVKRGGVYYLMWSEGGWTNASYGAAYGRSDNPYGPFEREGILLQNDPLIAEGAGHHSVLQLPGSEDEWIICYHRRPLGDRDPHHRVTCIDRLRFRADGSIAPVVMTNEGVNAPPR